MKDFFERAEARAHAWPAGRRDLHWHLLPPDVEQAREALLDPYAELIGYPGLVLVPPRWLHVTVLHSGPRDEASDEEIVEITGRVGDAVAGTGAVELIFSRPSIGTVAIERPARAGAPARQLWEAAWSATARVVGERWPLQPEIYYPHVTIAYAGRDAHFAHRTDLKALLSDTDGGDVTMAFSELTLVSQWHTHQHIVWEPLAAVPLT